MAQPVGLRAPIVRLEEPITRVRWKTSRALPVRAAEEAKPGTRNPLTSPVEPTVGASVLYTRSGQGRTHDFRRQARYLCPGGLQVPSPHRGFSANSSSTPRCLQPYVTCKELPHCNDGNRSSIRKLDMTDAEHQFHEPYRMQSPSSGICKGRFATSEGNEGF